MKTKIFLVLTLILLTTILSGCIESENEQIYNEEKYDDEEFLIWVSSSATELQSYTTGISSALSSENFYTLEYYAEAMGEYIDDTLKTECQDFVLNPKYDRIRNEFYRMLDDASWGAFYFKYGAKYAQIGSYDLAIEDIEIAADYIEKARIHTEECTRLIRQIN